LVFQSGVALVVIGKFLVCLGLDPDTVSRKGSRNYGPFTELDASGNSIYFLSGVADSEPGVGA
jgi:hypothetical protein